ncbi:MAG: ATPase, partial [Cyanobacteria bacterium]|nr:ATPase [Cyanobacteriota bacterium]MDW8201193.1 potassium transporter TrkG [Cyanobacteriota bacterium SKYGB_h_bin112]
YYTPIGQFVLMMEFQVGGLGYMTMTTFLLILIGKRFRLRDKLAIQQALDTPGLGGSKQIVTSIIAVTLIIELTGTFLLFLAFKQTNSPRTALWLALFHSISAFNNAGFSLFPNSLMTYVQSPLVSLTISGLIILGGIGYQVIMEAFLLVRDRLQQSQRCIILSLNFKIATATTAVLLIVGTIAFLVTEFHNPDTLKPLGSGGKLLAAWFQSVTTRTAGFNTIDNGKMTTAALCITIALMFIGASPGSTGGGIKTTTVRVLLAATRAALQGSEYVHMFQRQIPTALVLKAVGVFVGSLITVICASTLISLTDPTIDFIKILFESVSAFATVGLSMGITAQLSKVADLVLIATMYIGRVGVLLLMAAFYGDASPSTVRRPEEDLLVG